MPKRLNLSWKPKKKKKTKNKKDAPRDSSPYNPHSSYTGPL